MIDNPIAEISTSSQTDSLASIKIPGIDTELILMLYGDNLDVFISVLHTFANSTPAILDSLSDVTKENLAQYAISVHGLKGASANIGAESIRILAERLEHASKAGDLKGVLDENFLLHEKTRVLIENINKWLSSQSITELKPEKSYIDQSLLEMLQTCCENYDMNGADEILEELLKSSYSNDNDFVEWLNEKITYSEFDEAAERIRKHIKT